MRKLLLGYSVLVLVAFGVILDGPAAGETNKMRVPRKPAWVSDEFFFVSRAGKIQDSIVLFRVTDSAPIQVAEYPVAKDVVCVSAPPGQTAFAVVAAPYSARIGILDTRSRRISWLSARGSYPAIDPHGKCVAFLWGSAKGYDLFVWDRTRQRRREITHGFFVRYFRWSPAGDEIAFVSSGRRGDYSAHRFVGVSSADGRHSHYFPPDNRWKGVLGWSNDGEHLFFIAYDGGNANLVSKDKETGEETTLMAGVQRSVPNEAGIRSIWRGSFLIFPASPSRVGRLDAKRHDIAYVDFGQDITDWAPSPSGSLCAAITERGQVVVRAWK